MMCGTEKAHAYRMSETNNRLESIFLERLYGVYVVPQALGCFCVVEGRTPLGLTCKAPPTIIKPIAIHIANLRPVFSQTAKDKIQPEKAPRLYIDTCERVRELKLASPKLGDLQ